MVFTLIKEHALCLTAEGDSVLKEIGINYTGGIALGKTYLISDSKKHEVSGDYGSWLSFGKSDESSQGSDGNQFFISPAKIDFSQLKCVTVQEWLDKNIHDTNRAEIIRLF